MLLASFLLAATVSVSPEVSSWTMERAGGFATVPFGALALARDARGVVIAWSAGPPPSHIYVARLDATLRVIDGTQREIPTLNGSAFDADYPQLSVVDGNCVLLWRERERLYAPTTPNAIVMSRLSPDLSPSMPQVVATLSGSTCAMAGPGDDGDVLFLADPLVYVINRAGALQLRDKISGVFDGAAFAPGHVVYFAHDYAFHGTCHCDWAFCHCPQFWEGHVVIDGNIVAKIPSDTYDGPTSIAIATDGVNSVVAWPAQNRMNAIRVLRGFADTGNAPIAVGPVSDVASPSIATDGDRWLIVWQTRRPGAVTHDVAGAVLTLDGNVTPFVVASDGSDKQLPTVTAAGPGVFIVAYEIDVDAMHRQLAGRYVTFVPPHPRPGGK